MIPSDILPLDILVSFQETGSHYICDPPVVTSGIDYIVLVNNVPLVKQLFDSQGYNYISKLYNNTNFFSYDKYDTTFIITDSTSNYLRFAAATELCKKMNILDKGTRISIFKGTIEGFEDKVEWALLLPYIHSHTSSSWEGIHSYYEKVLKEMEKK